MIRLFFLLLNILTHTQLATLNNPFSCTRSSIPTTKPQSSFCQDFKFIGIVKSEKQHQVMVRWQENLLTVHAGTMVGPVKIQEIFDKSIRIIVAKEEYILTLESE